MFYYLPNSHHTLYNENHTHHTTVSKSTFVKVIKILSVNNSNNLIICTFSIQLIAIVFARNICDTVSLLPSLDTSLDKNDHNIHVYLKLNTIIIKRLYVEKLRKWINRYSYFFIKYSKPLLLYYVLYAVSFNRIENKTAI